MKKFLSLCSPLVVSLILPAQAVPKLLFEDDFERSEKDDTQEEIGKGWESNSARRAKGNKQVDLKDGAMHITFHPEADHAVSVTHDAGFKDGKVELRFMLENEDDSLGLNFADMKYKKVHAGHLCMAKISTKRVQISDLKTGVMDKETRKLRMEKKLTAKMKKELKSKAENFPVKVAKGKWHTLQLMIIGDTMTVTIDQKKVGSFSSEGIAHAEKGTLRLAVPKKAVVDDLKIFSLSGTE